MSNVESQVKVFTTRVRQLVLQYKNVKKENDELYTLVDQRDKEIASLKEQLKKAKNEYETLKLAKMIEVTDNDLDVTKKRVAKLIRDVNKCITLLSEK